MAKKRTGRKKATRRVGKSGGSNIADLISKAVQQQYGDKTVTQMKNDTALSQATCGQLKQGKVKDFKASTLDKLFPALGIKVVQG